MNAVKGCQACYLYIITCKKTTRLVGHFELEVKSSRLINLKKDPPSEIKKNNKAGLLCTVVAVPPAPIHPHWFAAPSISNHFSESLPAWILLLPSPRSLTHTEGMFAAVEHGPVLCSDSNILCLSWKGRVPKSEKEKPVCRKRYYEEGWLATGNGRGVVGVTFTSSHCRRDRTTPQRINFNLRGHNSEVSQDGVCVCVMTH